MVLLEGNHPKFHKKATLELRALIEKEVSEQVGSTDVRCIMRSLHDNGMIDDTTYEIFNLAQDEIITLVEKYGNSIYDKVSFLGLETLYKRYFFKQAVNDDHTVTKVVETLPSMMVRVACGYSIKREDAKKTKRFLLSFLRGLLRFDFLPSTPGLLNAGKINAQLASCFGNSVGDSLDDILENNRQNSILAKHGGGTSSVWDRVRCSNSPIYGGGKHPIGNSGGVLSFMQVLQASLNAVRQNHSRTSAHCVYIPIDHYDVEEVMEAKKNTGDHRLRLHDINTAVWACDLYMVCVLERADWYLFDPNEVHRLFGFYLNDFYDEAYYNSLAELDVLVNTKPESVQYAVAYKKCVAAYHEGKLKVVKKTTAYTLWKKHLSMIYQTGHPWLVFKDHHNRDNPNKHLGVIRSSNLCTEIKLVIQKVSESLWQTFVCVLASINLANAVTDDNQVDFEHLKEMAGILIEALDNACSIMHLPIEGAMDFLRKQSPLGLGIMGYHTLLCRLEVAIDSQEAQILGEQIMMTINNAAIEKSSELAKEYGCYPEWEGSEWHKRGIPMRNSTVTAIAPTATISIIANVSESILPPYGVYTAKSTSTNTNSTSWSQIFLEKLEEYGVELTEALVVNIVENEGKVEHINFEGLTNLSPKQISMFREVFKQAFSVNQFAMIDLAAVLQKHVTQAISLNLYEPDQELTPSEKGNFMSSLYIHAWKSRLPSTYYFRTLSSTSVTKTVTNDSAISSCRLDDETCEACQ